ncbi:hypothetical protein [Helicobacter rodentium]|uniref:hypothetical protein n=1 Tax=Helicobacter rodentium TaxID=59617 RepID=UPI0025A4E616|nr:hypothetical protein [Helicobacter rodentium]
MFKTIDERKNIIYHFKPLENILQNSKIHFVGSENILFLSEKSYLKNTNINFGGKNALVFIGDSTMTADSIDVQHESVCFIGNNNYFNPASRRSFAATERKNIVVGNHCLISYSLWFRTADPHLIYDRDFFKRINPSKSIYLGDHIWIGQEAGFVKGGFVASGSIIGAKSLVVGKKYHSNTINAGNPCKQVKEGIFWSGECVHSWDKATTMRYEIMREEKFSFSYNQDSFLSPKSIEAKLESLQSTQEKLEFVYDYLYCNTNKNRFAYFENCPFEIPLPSMTKQFKKLNFEIIKSPKLTPQVAPAPNPLQERITHLESILFGTATTRIQNHLNYQLGQILIQDSKSLFGISKLPFKILLTILKHKNKQKQYQTNIKNNPHLKLPPLESYPDYKESLKIKNYFSYKLGEAFLTSISAGGGGFLPLYAKRVS